MKNRSGFAALLALAAALPSCKEERIERYRVAKASEGDARAPAVTSPNQPAEGHETPARILGALAAHRGETWVFKFFGPPDAVAAEKDRFDGFVRSLTLRDSGDPPVAWKVPEGWIEEGPSGKRFATLRPSGGISGVELSVTRFSGDAGGIAGNVNRWRDQVGLPALGEAEAEQAAARVEVGGREIRIVDVTGRSRSGGGMAGPFAGGRPPGHPESGSPAAPPGHGTGPADLPPDHGGAPAPPPFAFTAPQGWTRIESTGLRAAAFRAGPKGGEAEVTVINAGGSELENLNIWRGQLGLEPVGALELPKFVKKIEAATRASSCVDVAGAEADGAARGRILVVIVPHGNSSWFFKMTGLFDVVEKERENFESFVKSLRFSEPPPEKPAP